MDTNVGFNFDDFIEGCNAAGLPVAAVDESQDVCMNPGIPSCEMCLFNGRTYKSGAPWCKPEEREAKNS